MLVDIWRILYVHLSDLEVVQQTCAFLAVIVEWKLDWYQIQAQSVSRHVQTLNLKLYTYWPASRVYCDVPALSRISCVGNTVCT